MFALKLVCVLLALFGANGSYVGTPVALAPAPALPLPAAYPALPPYHVLPYAAPPPLGAFGYPPVYTGYHPAPVLKSHIDFGYHAPIAPIAPFAPIIKAPLAVGYPAPYVKTLSPFHYHAHASPLIRAAPLHAHYAKPFLPHAHLLKHYAPSFGYPHGHVFA